MAEGAIFLNSGPLFKGEGLETLEDTAAWTELDEAARLAYERVRESFEAHSTLLAGNPSVQETRYHMINPSLHALQYTFSVSEVLPLSDEVSARVGYVCFENADEFYAAEPSRGTLGFYRNALTLVHAKEWGADLDATGDEEGEGGIHAAQELDLLMRTTGRDFAILTNGCDWRLYHRGSAGQINTFFQADMIAAMKSDFEDFKRFYLLFNAGALTRDDSGRSFLDTLLP